MKKLLRHLFKLLLCLSLFFVLGCPAPKHIPEDLNQLKTAEALGLASQRSYQKAREEPEKKEKLKYSHAGIIYSEKCLKKNEKEARCLYYNVLNRGVYIKNYHPDYQKSLRLMIKHCLTLIGFDPGFENAGCYRVLGNIYAKAPSFSLNPKNITRDLEKSVEYLREAVKLSPNYALNHLFLARSLLSMDENSEAHQQLKEFDRLVSSNLDKEYPQWKKERDNLARKLQQN